MYNFDMRPIVIFCFIGLAATFIGGPILAWKVIAYLIAHLAWVS
jgi:hypothetical protein